VADSSTYHSMAKRTKNLVGLDIDPSGITAARVAVNGRISIEQAAFAPLEPGIVNDGEVADVEGLATALRTLFREHKGLGKRVRVGVANQKIVVRAMELPYLSDPKELSATVRFHAQDQLPMPLDQAVMDFQPLEVVDGGDGRRQRLLLVAARRDMVDRVLTAVSDAGLRAEGLDLSAFAMIRALHRPSGDAEHVLYLAVGGLTNLAVANGTRCLFTRASGGGVEALAVELAETCQLTLDHARGWLEHVGLRSAVEDIEGDPAIVGPARRLLLDGARRIAAEVRNSLDFHHAQGGDTHVARAVLSGPASAIPGFDLALSSELGMPVSIGGVDGAPAGIDGGRLAVAAGLAVEEVPA
jgi:type IV pilus assembly protein PilM